MRLHSSHRLTLFCGLMSIALLAATAPAQQRSGRRPPLVVKQVRDLLRVEDVHLAPVGANREASGLGHRSNSAVGGAISQYPSDASGVKALPIVSRILANSAHRTENARLSGTESQRRRFPKYGLTIA